MAPSMVVTVPEFREILARACSQAKLRAFSLVSAKFEPDSSKMSSWLGAKVWTQGGAVESQLVSRCTTAFYGHTVFHS